MEIPVIDRISDLQNPSFIPNFLAFSGIPNIYQAYSVCKWGALILALLASFSTILNRIKFLIVKLQTHHFFQPPSHTPILDEFSDYDSESDTSFSSISDDDDDDDDEEEEESEIVDGDFSVRGSDNYYADDGHYRNRGFNLRRRRNRSIGELFSWSELTNGTNVVKLWDNIGLGFGLNLKNNESPNNVIYAGSSYPPAVVLSADTSFSAEVLGVWDTRVGCRIPQVMAERRPRLGRIFGLSAGSGRVEKVYVRDDVTESLMVGDMRKAGSPLEDLTESDVDTWWDADAVIVTEECFDELRRR